MVTALSQVAIVGIHNTEQARTLPGHDTDSIAFEAAFGALRDAGIAPCDLDGVIGGSANTFIHQTGIGPTWSSGSLNGITSVLEAATAIAAGLASTVLVLAGGAGTYTDRAAAAPWTRPTNEFVAPYGMITAAQFALVARRHMYEYGTTPEALAEVAATIRNNGHVNREAVYFGRGPFTANDVLESRMIADPFHLLDCAMTSEGGCALVLARRDVALDCRLAPVWILGGNTDHFGPSYRHPPSANLGGRRRSDLDVSTVGRRACELAMSAAGVVHADIDVLELYDPFSFEIIRQLEAFGFCAPGEGGDFVLDGHVAPDGRFPVTTDGGLLSYSHAGIAVQKLQRVVRSVEQLRGTCTSRQVIDAEVALCSGGGSGAMFSDVMILGSRPR